MPGVDQAQLQVTGEALLAGRIDVEWSGGYVPEAGTNFMVMSYASHTGEFDFENGFYLLGDNRRIVPLYSATSLRLDTIASPDPTGVPAAIARAADEMIVAWPAEFKGYDLYFSTNLPAGGWTLIPAITNVYREFPPYAPQKFFKVE